MIHSWTHHRTLYAFVDVAWSRNKQVVLPRWCEYERWLCIFDFSTRIRWCLVVIKHVRSGSSELPNTRPRGLLDDVGAQGPTCCTTELHHDERNVTIPSTALATAVDSVLRRGSLRAICSHPQLRLRFARGCTLRMTKHRQRKYGQIPTALPAEDHDVEGPIGQTR